MIELSFGDVETTLAELAWIADDKRIAFRARLKHLQRLGFPPGANTGTGRKATYTASMAFKMCFALEFMQAGLSPKRVVEMVNGNWSQILRSTLIALTPHANARAQWVPPLKTGEVLLLCSPEALRELTISGESETDYDGVLVGIDPLDLPNRLLAFQKEIPKTGEMYRHLIIQVRRFTYVVMNRLQNVRPDITFFAVWSDLRNEAVSEGEEIPILEAHDFGDT